MNSRAPAPLPLPPRPRNRAGVLRRVGVEIELGGLDIDTLSALVARHLVVRNGGGTIVRVSRYEHRIEGDPNGAWMAELDFAYLKNRGREQRETAGVWAQLDEAAEDLLRVSAEPLVPMEVVSPPLPLDQLHEFDSLVALLRTAGARGTRDGLAFAFGLHLNPELPDTDTATVLAYLRAFLCLFDWLKLRSRVDLTRRLTLFADPFPVDYVRRVLAPDYVPDQATLIDDYLDANPTRNRALDMLPLFAWLDPPRVRARIDDARVKARPTLHYRLPNSEVDRPGWGLREAWLDWLQVEYLAADPARITEVAHHYAVFLERPIGRLFEDWGERVGPWLHTPNDR